ncbi:MAG TPA: hypothetical protein VJU15_00395 [Gemmatimonadales bacterium]|nr:hypothetical protein [Gemmatimonadales bacterium]
MRFRAAALLLTLAACSSLSPTEGGVSSVTIEVPSPAEVEVDGSIQLRATARGADGEALDIPIYWRALDTTIAVDSVAGVLTGISAGKQGKVVARAIDLYSAVATFTVLSRADTVIVVGDSVVTVESNQEVSPSLTVRVEAGDPPVAVDKRRVTFEVVSPVFANLEDRTVEFTNGQLAQSIATTTTGQPSPLPTLRRREGKTAPDTAIVQVSAYRPGGGTVPGSGQHFLVLFPR